MELCIQRDVLCSTTRVRLCPRYSPECITLEVSTSAGFAREERLCGLGGGDGVV